VRKYGREKKEKQRESQEHKMNATCIFDSLFVGRGEREMTIMMTSGFSPEGRLSLLDPSSLTLPRLLTMLTNGGANGGAPILSREVLQC
jgi:hypothetical protein